MQPVIKKNDSPDTRAEDALVVHAWRSSELASRLSGWVDWCDQHSYTAPARNPRWLEVLRRGLRQQPYCLEAMTGGKCVGLLPLAFVRSALFGRFLVSLPYLNVGGLMASDPKVISALIDRAVSLADELNVRYLELRHETEIEHPALTERNAMKVNMQLALPDDSETLWSGFKPKVRNQIRKGEKMPFKVQWGGVERLGDFHAVFSRNMRDLGTPSYGKGFFRQILEQLSGDAEICTLRLDRRPVAAALLVHGREITEVPSASSLRDFNATNVNMLMYWHLLQRACERGQQIFDFGRSSLDGGTYRFKKQWGAQPKPTVWQYYVRRGSISAMRPDDQRNQRLIRIWQRLPVVLTRVLGPVVVRGIP